MSLLPAAAIGSATMLLLGLSSGYIKNRLSISEPLIALLVGVALGPYASGLLDAAAFGLQDPLVLLEYGALVTLALSVMGAALRLPRNYVRDHWRELAGILTVGMVSMAVVSGLIAWALVPVSLLGAALIGAIVAPTDPVLADSIVTGKVAEDNVPGRMRHSISAESGANDGLAVLLVMLPLLLLEHAPGGAVTSWLSDVLVRETVGGLLLGIAIGMPCGLMLRKSCNDPSSEHMSLLTVSIALAFTVLGVSKLLQVSGVIASFASGIALNQFLCQRNDVRREHLQEAVSRFFDLPIIILFGAFLPWHAWVELGIGTVLAAVLILLLRRLPAWLLLWRVLPSLHARRDALYNGWFGPIGIAALYYALKAHDEHDIELVWPVVSLVVCASIVVHGISATPLTRRYRGLEGAGDLSKVKS
jgi:NhaP-type Na+/H+ or K+/H+ antiporter